MHKRRAFRPAAPEGLEDRVVLHNGADHASAAADVFTPLMGRILTPAYVFGNHLSRSEALDIVADQVSNAFRALRAGLVDAMDGLIDGGEHGAYQADIEALCDGLATRCIEILSTSPRAQRFLVPFVGNQLNGTGANSLPSQLAAVSFDDDPEAFQSATLGAARAMLRRMVNAIDVFDANAVFPFPAGDGSGGPVDGPTTPTTPTQPAPTNLAAVGTTSDSVSLAWTGAVGATGYLVERSTDGVNWALTGTTAAGTTSFAATGLSPGTSYRFRVSATSAAGNSVPSAVVTARTGAAAPPDVPRSVLLAPLSSGHDGLELHVHPNLSIFIDGQQQLIPANTNVTAQGLFPLHTHDATGKLHVESNQVFTYRLGEFFDTWAFTTGDASKAWTDTQFLGRPIDSAHRVTVTVDGRTAADGRNVILNNDDGTLQSESGKVIVVRYETAGAS